MASGRLIDYIGGGVAAARPAALSLTQGAIGLYFAIDTKALTVWDGDSWEIPAAAPSSTDWGDIGGTLADQLDLKAALDGKVSEALSNGKSYMRKDGSWVEYVVPPAYVPKNVFTIFLPEMKLSGAEYVRSPMPYAGSISNASITGTLSANPTADRALTFYKNGASIGTVSISAAGAFTAALTTTAFAAGDILKVDGAEDTTAKNVALLVKMN